MAASPQQQAQQQVQQAASPADSQQSASQKIDPLGVSVVAQLYDAEEGYVITAMDSFANFVFLGFDSGALQRLEIQFDPQDPTNIFTSVTQTDFGMPRRKHRIKQLVHSSVEPFLIVLCHQQLTILHSETFRPIKQVATDVGCCSLSLATPQSLLRARNNSINNPLVPTTTTTPNLHQQQPQQQAAAAAAAINMSSRASSNANNSRSLIHRICSSEKEARGLSVHEFCFQTSQLRDSVDNFVFPERVRCVAEANGFLYVGLSREYSVLSMETGDVRRLVPLNGCTPQIAICDPHYGYFLLESVVFSVSVDRMPAGSQAGLISFEGNATPNTFTTRPGTLFAFTDRHCTVYSTTLQRQLQKLAIPDCQFVSHKPCEVLLPPPFGGTTIKARPLPTNNNNNDDSSSSSNNNNNNSSDSTTSVGDTTVTAQNSEDSTAAAVATQQQQQKKAGVIKSYDFYPLDEVPASIVFVASKSRLHLMRMFPVEKQLRELVVRRFRIDCAEDLLRGYMLSPVLSPATEMLERLLKVMAGFSRLRRGLVEEGLATFASLVDVRQILRVVPSLVSGTEYTTLRRPTFLAAVANCPERCAEAFLFRQLVIQQHGAESAANAFEKTLSAQSSCRHGAAAKCPHEATMQFILSLIVCTADGENAAAVDAAFWHEWHAPAIVQPPAALLIPAPAPDGTPAPPGAPGAPPLFYDARIESLQSEWEKFIDFDKVAALSKDDPHHLQQIPSSSTTTASRSTMAANKISSSSPGNNNSAQRAEMIKREMNNLWSRLRISMQGYLNIFVDDAAKGNLLDPTIACAGARRAAEYALLVLSLLGGTDQARHDAIVAAVRGDIAVAPRVKKSKRGSMAAASAAASSSGDRHTPSATLGDLGDTMSVSSALGGAAAGGGAHSHLAPFQPLQHRPLHRIANMETYPVVSLLRSCEFLPLRDCVGIFAASQEWRLMLLLARQRNRIHAEVGLAPLPWREEASTNGAGDRHDHVVPRARVQQVLEQHVRQNPAVEFFARRLSVWRQMEQAGVDCPGPEIMEWCHATLGIDELPDGVRAGSSSTAPPARSGAAAIVPVPAHVVDDAHGAFIALEHLDFSELRNINKADPTAIERLRDSDGLTVLHHLVFLMAHSQVDERVEMMLSNENAAAKREQLEQEGAEDESEKADSQQRQQTASSHVSPSLPLFSRYSGGSRVAGPIKEARMKAICNLVRFFVVECRVDMEVRAPCIVDTDGNLMLMNAAEFALALSFTGANVGSSIRFVHALDSATVVGALCAARCQIMMSS